MMMTASCGLCSRLRYRGPSGSRADGRPTMGCVPSRRTVVDMANKTERFAVRLTAEQDALIRQAAEVEGTDLTNFTVTATLAHARDVLADRRLFTLDDTAWKKFQAVLERPVTAKPRLAELFAEPTVFDAP